MTDPHGFAQEIRAMQAEADEMSWAEQEEQDDLFAPREGVLPCCEHCTHGPLIFGHPAPCAGCEDEAAASGHARHPGFWEVKGV